MAEPERRDEPITAHLYFVPRALRRPQAALVQRLRPYFERAPSWVLLTTRGRKTGLPREVLLPCWRSDEAILVISTYGWRSQWIRNLREDPSVRVTCGGRVLPGWAEVVEDPEARRTLIGEHPFFPAAPFAIAHALLRTPLRPALVGLLRRWVETRPIVVIRLGAAGGGQEADEPESA
jgi:deazaflavin-dependent oxidoreductase (nitroreductase family)